MATSTIKFEDAITTITPTITVSGSATQGSTYVKRSGKVVVARLGFVIPSGTTIAAGANICVGTISTSSMLPAITTMITGYYGARSIMMSIESNGSFLVRNASSSSLEGSGAEVVVAGTWIAAD